MDGAPWCQANSEDRAAAVQLLSTTDAGSDARDLHVTDHRMAATEFRPEMALGQRPENSVAANSPYTCLLLHNVIGMLCRTIETFQFKRQPTRCRSVK